MFKMGLEENERERERGRKRYRRTARKLREGPAARGTAKEVDRALGPFGISTLSTWRTPDG